MDGKKSSLIKKPLRKLRGLLFLSRFCICIAALLSTSSIKPAFSQERKINIAYAGPSLIALPFLAAQEWKLFSQNGLSTQLVVMTFTISIPALSAEQVEYLGGVGPATVSATLRGIPARAVWFSSDKVLWSLMAQSQMKTLSDLRQKPIGMTDREAPLQTYGTRANRVAGDGGPRRAGIENMLQALVLQGRVPSSNVPFEENADRRIATEVARELGYKVE